MAPRNGRLWSPEEVSRLTALAMPGVSAAMIARALASEGFPSRSREAVLGQSRRLGIVLAGVKGGSSPRQPAKSAEPRRRSPAPRAVQKAGGAGVPFLEVRNGQCRWPLWSHAASLPHQERLVCGAPVVCSGVYCAEHHRLAHAGAKEAV